MEKVVSMGLLVSKFGVVQQRRRYMEANSPSTPTEVERFLGTVGVSA